MEDGRVVSYELYKELLPSELDKIKAYVGESAFNAPTMNRAIALFDELIQVGEYKEFLTLDAYNEIN
jgi:malate synthase